MHETKGITLALQRVSDDVSLISFSYEQNELKVLMSVDGHLADVVFPSVSGFRVLDEGDLLEFWAECNLSNGWLFEITHGGWFELESNREGFVSAHKHNVKECLVVSKKECVSVFCNDSQPIITWRPSVS